MLVTRIFPFPTMFSKGFFFKVVKSWNVAINASLFTKQQNFGLVQIESICRQQNKCDSKIKVCHGMSRKHCATRAANCLTPSCKAGACTKQNSSMKNNKGH